MAAILFTIIQEDRALGQAAVLTRFQAPYADISRDQLLVALNFRKHYKLGKLTEGEWKVWIKEYDHPGWKLTE